MVTYYSRGTFDQHFKRVLMYPSESTNIFSKSTNGPLVPPILATFLTTLEKFFAKIYWPVYSYFIECIFALAKKSVLFRCTAKIPHARQKYLFVDLGQYLCI